MAREDRSRLGLLIFLAACVCFLGTLRNQFVWDDSALIVRTIAYRDFAPRHLRWMLTTLHVANWTPLAWLSYAVDYSIWRLNPVGYHLTNLLLHALNAVLFFRLAALLLRAAFGSEKPRTLELGAAFAALAFALHPLRVESVAWASERRDVLSGFFYLSTLLLYAKAAAGERGARERSRLRAASIVCFACAALSKATVVPLPAALLALDYYPLRRTGANGRPVTARALLVEKIPYALIAAAAATMAIRAQLAMGGLVAVEHYGLWRRLAQSLGGAGFYVLKTAVPTGLSALYPLRESRSLLLYPALESLAALAAVEWSMIYAGVVRKARISLWFYYLALLSPVLGLVQNGPQLVALRYSYLSCLGWALLLGCAAVSALRLRARSPARGAAVLAALGLWLASNAWSVQNQIAVWHDEKTLWTSVLRRFPLSPDANINLSGALLREKDLRGAEAYAQISLKLVPDNHIALLNLAVAQEEEHRDAEAQATLERGLSTPPEWGEGHSFLGVLLARQGKNDEALAHILRAAALMPNSAEAQSNAGSALAMRKRYSEALPYFERAAIVDPDDPAVAGRLAHLKQDLALSLSRQN
jgi:tetratricopeptide (TPR) repeat protein